MNELTVDRRTRRMVSFAVSPHLMEEALHFPKGVRICGAEWDWMSETVRLYVEGDCIPFEIKVGERAKDICPAITRNYDEETGKESYTWHWDGVVR